MPSMTSTLLLKHGNQTNQSNPQDRSNIANKLSINAQLHPVGVLHQSKSLLEGAGRASFLGVFTVACLQWLAALNP